jgi:two-component system sensor histidine kinase PhoQ
LLSLNARLLVAASVVLAAFLGLTGLTLDKAFRDSALAAVRDRLQAQIYILLGAADLDQSGVLVVPDTLPEARFSTPGTGLYGQVSNAAGQVVWRSPSMLGTDIPFPPIANTGMGWFRELTGPHGTPLFVLGFGVTWEVGPGRADRYTFYVAESRKAFDQQISGFRHSLLGWLAGAALVLLAVQGSILRWSLAPLRRVAREVAEIETGERKLLSGHYPIELRHLTANLNALIQHSQAHLERYRNALADLAHSLKTPLAVLRGAVEGEADLQALREAVQAQVDRMGDTVDYQLQRAAASGRLALTAPLALRPVVDKVLQSLSKVYADRAVVLANEVEDVDIAVDEGDLMEIVGNLADNACKWARGRVLIRGYHPHDTPSAGLVLEVEDDGPGLAGDQVKAVLSRGVRGDPHTAGHGIGLAVVRGLVEEVYRGSIAIDQGPLGGTRVRVTLPG